MKEIVLSHSARKAIFSLFFFVGFIIFFYLFDFANLFSKSFFITTVILFCLFLLMAVAFFAKLISPYLSKNLKETAHWIHAIIWDVLFQISAYLMLPLSMKKWESQKNQKKPILLVHGYLHFNSVWLYHIKKLEKRYGPIYTLNLGYPFSSIETFSAKVLEKITEIQKQTKKKEIILIGHSMGGLICSYLTLFKKSSMKICAVMTLGSPLKGTKIASIALGTCAKQMSYGSDFTKKVEQKIKKNTSIPFFHLAAKRDQIIRPFSSALMGIDNQKEKILDDVGHVGLLFSQKVAMTLENWLSEI